VNVSSHQAQRAVRGALPYATAKAAVEGLTRATAVDYGPHGIRANAVALGSVATERFEQLLASRPDDAERIERDIARLHPVGRCGQRSPSEHRRCSGGNRPVPLRRGSGQRTGPRFVIGWAVTVCPRGLVHR
jgi:NAD(P)-dependent dehydrogenase (short-subunit alcohol dehydrogenase family)